MGVKEEVLEEELKVLELQIKDLEVVILLLMMVVLEEEVQVLLVKMHQVVLLEVMVVQD